MRGLILGERPSSGGPHPTITASSTTRQLDRVRPSWPDEFDSRNVWPYADSDDDRVDLSELLSEYAVVVALGFTVAQELKLPHAAHWLSWHKRDAVSILRMPHPSGVNRWWNDPLNRANARVALSQAVRLRDVA